MSSAVVDQSGVIQHPVTNEQAKEFIKQKRKSLDRSLLAASTDQLFQGLIRLEVHRGHGCPQDNPEEAKLIRKHLNARGISVRIKIDKFRDYVSKVQAINNANN